MRLGQAKLLLVSEDAIQSAERLFATAAIPERAGADALRIALAAVHGIGYLLTWSCTPIANAASRGRVEATCISAGYRSPVLGTPEELMP